MPAYARLWIIRVLEYSWETEIYLRYTNNKLRYSIVIKISL